MFSLGLKILQKILPTWIYRQFIGDWEKEGFKKYLFNTNWMFFGQMFNLLITFFVGAWIARYLGPENYGIINYSLAFVGMFTFVAQLGVAAILSRELVKYPEKRDSLMGTSFMLLLLSGLVAFVLVIISVSFFESSEFLRILIILYSSTFLWSAFGVIQIFFQSSVKAKKNVYASVISSTVSSILKILLIVFGKGVVWLMCILVFESLFSIVLIIIIYKKNGYNLKSWKYDSKLAKNILSGSWLMMLAASASYLFMKVDQVMIGKFLGEYSVGLYAVAVRLVEIWYFIPGLICSSLFPAIVNAKKVNEGKYHNRLKKLYILLILIAVFIAIPSTILAPWVIKTLFGTAYLGAVEILRIYVWSGIGLFLLWGIQQYFLVENKLKITFYTYLLLMIMNVILNLLFIPKFGLSGAAWATLISYSVGPVVSVGILRIWKNKK